MLFLMRLRREALQRREALMRAKVSKIIQPSIDFMKAKEKKKDNLKGRKLTTEEKIRKFVTLY